MVSGDHGPSVGMDESPVPSHATPRVAACPCGVVLRFERDSVLDHLVAAAQAACVRLA
jgi:hypothetical protein